MVEGSLRNVSLSDVFQVVATAQKSGILTLVRGVVRARVYFEQGRIQYAHISPGVHLGEILVRMDLLSAREVQEILLRQVQENAGTPLGLTAVALGYLEQADLRRALERQVFEVLSELLGWKSGSFTFAERSGLASQVPTEHALDAMALLMQVARQLAEAEEGSADPKAIFQRAGDPTRAEVPPGGWDVLAAVDGRRSAASVASEVDLPERQVYRILHLLERQGVVRAAPFAVEEPVVLVVTPSSALQRLLRLALQRARLQPQVALDFDAAMRLLQECHPRAVVVDDEDGAGWRFVRELRSLPGQRHLPVLVLTAEAARRGPLARLLRPHARELAKPFDELELQRLLSSMLGRNLA